MLGSMGEMGQTGPMEGSMGTDADADWYEVLGKPGFRGRVPGVVDTSVAPSGVVKSPERRVDVERK